MKEEQFTQKVEISDKTFADSFPDIAIELEQGLNKQFPNQKLKVFYVVRPQHGLIHGIHVVEISEKEWYTLNTYPINTTDDQEAFDWGDYQKKRFSRLRCLDPHLPKTFFFSLKTVEVMMQEFLFLPIATFDKVPEQVIDFYRIVALAAKEGILLDYNANHWLWDEKTNRVYYVDKNYLQEDFSIEEAARENFHQSTVFLTPENIEWYIKGIKHLDTPETQKVFDSIVQRIHESVKSFQSPSTSEKLIIKCYRRLAEAFTTKNS